MVKALRNLPVHRKLTMITMVTTCLALLIASVAIGVYEHVTFRRAMVRNLSMTAEMTGANIASALNFNDPDSAGKTLDSLSTQPHVTAACVYDVSGKSFAVYRRQDLTNEAVPLTFQATGHEFSTDRLGLFQEIQTAGERNGGIYVESDLKELNERSTRYTLMMVIVIIIVSIFILYISAGLQRSISGPISQLSNVAARIAEENNYTLRAKKSDDGELGKLMDAFNHMLSQIQMRDEALQEARQDLEVRVTERTEDLRQSCETLKQEILERQQTQARLDDVHKELVAASRFAGMAEVATGVLHNVGNVLNSVNVAAGIIMDRVETSRSANLDKLAALLTENENNLESFFSAGGKGKHLPGYIRTLAKQVAAERAEMTSELKQLQKHIEHIKTIVTMQQSYAKTSGVVETVSPVELIEDAVRINSGGLARHHVDILREYHEVPSIKIDRHKVLQILVNLIRNAKYACDESGKDERWIKLRLVRTDNIIEICVIDNGVGISEENLTRIFNHGFTTRAEGHGFGLHSGALAAQELGGTLGAHSEGLGKGARFTLTIPVNLEAKAAAA